MEESEAPRDPGIKVLEDKTRLQLHEALLATLEGIRVRGEVVVLDMETNVQQIPHVKTRPVMERTAFYQQALADYNRFLTATNGPDGVNEQHRLLCNSANMLGKDGLITEKERLERIAIANERRQAVRTLGERGAAALGKITSVL